MKNLAKIFALSSILAISSLAANATTITMSAFDINDFNTATAGGTIQDFEGFAGGSWGAATVTNVGTFAAHSGTGSGSVCNAQSGGPCSDLYINDTVLSGQGNLVPLGGSKALSSNDTNGIFWTVAEQSGLLFNRIVFAVRDAADINGTVFTIDAGGTTAVLTGLANNNERLVVIDLGGSFAGATVSMYNNQSNDGFTIDGASIVSVPTPASALLLLGGLGMLGAMRKRKQKVA